jgi:hypothetical protein
MRISPVIRAGIFTFFGFVIFACSSSDDSPPGVQPTLTSLWNNLFSGCGVNCHSSNATDGTELGPYMDTKTNFRTNLVNNTVNNDYLPWATVKDGNCDNVKFITPGNANESTLASALILSVSDTIEMVHSCTSSYNIHDVTNQAISDNALKNALITWINDGAQDN